MSQALATQLHTHPLNIYTTFFCLCCSQNLHWAQNYTFQRGFFHHLETFYLSDLSVSTWGEGVVSPPRHRCGTETGVLKVCTACRRQSREGWCSNFQIWEQQEKNTDLNDPKKVSTGFRYAFEHPACLKINFHMEKKQNIQYINYHITNLCCVHV